MLAANDAEGKAVSNLNGSVDISGGSKDGDASGGIGGKIAIPAGDNFGAQIDTFYSNTDSVDAGGLAGHYFYRNPESYLLGATAMWYDTEGNDIYRYGAESQVYLGDFTVSPILGLQSGSANNGVKAYYGLDLNYYPQENIKFALGGSGYSDTQGVHGQVEWQPKDNAPYSFYANLGDYENSKAYALIGLRYSFGTQGQSLKHRDRYSDPDNIVQGTDNQAGEALLKDSTPAPKPFVPHCTSLSPFVC